MEINGIISSVQSSDYKEQFKAEYTQLKIREAKLGNMLDKAYKHELDFEPKYPLDLLDQQVAAMKEYLRILEKRAELEGIKLDC